MAIDVINAIEEENERRVHGLSTLPPGHVPVSTETHADQILKTHGLSPVIGATGNQSSAPLERPVQHISLANLKKQTEELEQVANNTIQHFPNLAWESVKAALAKESATNDRINLHVSEAEQKQKEIEQLLDLSADLTSMKEGQKGMSDKTRQILADLKANGTHLWDPNDSDFTKEKASELKSLASQRIDSKRSELQILYMTKIQVLIQNSATIMQAVQEIIKSNKQVIAVANQNARH